MDFAAAFMGSHIEAAESRRQGFIIGGNEAGTRTAAAFEQQGDDDDDLHLSGPDSIMRRTRIRQELAAKGCASVDEILSKNTKLCVEDVMILAARGNMVNVVAYCIESKGADATKLVDDCLLQQGMDTTTTMSGSSSNSSSNRRPKAMDSLLAAVEEGAAQVVEYLLTKGRANANSVSQGDGAPAIWAAAQSGHVYIIKLLLKHGANVNACKQDSGNSALFAAAQNGHALACSVLIQHGADLSLSKQQAQHPVPPLGVAIASARPDIMALLLNAGAKIHFCCLHIWRQVEESKKSSHFPYSRPLGPNVLYQMKALLDQAKFCTLLVDTNTQVKDHYQRARELEHQGKYRQALRALVDAQTAYLEFKKNQEPDRYQPSPPAWVQLQLDGERLTNYVYGCKGSDGRVSKWQRHVFYKDDLQPPQVIFASALYYEPHKKVYRWGGLVMTLHMVTEEYPLWAFDVNLKQWATVMTTGKSPGMRARHCAAILGPYMYVFAGTIGLKRIDNKLFRLHLETKVWELIKVKGSPPNSRENAAMCAYDGKLYVMGGEDSTDPLTDVWQFNPDNNKWKELRPAPDSPAKPLERYCHGMWACQNKLYFFGGQGLVPNSSVSAYRYQSWNNLQCFDLQTRHWNNIPNVGDFTWNFAEFLTLPLYRGQSEPSAVLLWGGYHETTNPDRWATHNKYDANYCNALYGDEIHDYRLPYRRRLLRFDCATHTWTNLKLLDSDIVMPTALCWGAELWDASSQDDSLMHIMVGGGYGLTHNSHTKGYTVEERLTMAMMGCDLEKEDIEKQMSTPDVSDQVYHVEILNERDYCAADQSLHLQGWAWQLYTTPLSRQPRPDFIIGFGAPMCFRVMEYFEQDFLHPPSGNSDSITAITNKWASIQDNDASLLGRRVVLDGLQAKPELNGKVCRCGVFDSKKQRYQVYLEPQQGVEGVVPMAIKSSNLHYADPLDANDFYSIFMNQQGQKPTPEVVAAWRSHQRYTTMDTRPHNLEKFLENEPRESSDAVMLGDSYKGPFSAEGRAMLHAVGRIVPKAQRSIMLFHTSKRDIRSEAAREGHDIFTNWVRQVHERDAERSQRYQQSIVAHRKTTGWETDEKKAKWLRVEVELDGIEPVIRRSIIVSPLISIHRLHHQVLAPVLGRQSNSHCYAFRQCHKFHLPEPGSASSLACTKEQSARHLELVHANWIGPKVSSALDGFFQPFYIGGEMADDQKIMLGDLFYREDNDDKEEMYIRYIHDFGDWWSHTLTVTKYSGAVPPDASVAHVLSGYGSCPPDDCGGIVEYIKKIHQLSGELEMKVDKDDHDAERAPLEDVKFVYPLKEIWWKCFNSMRQRNGFRGKLNQPIEFDLEASRRSLKEALRQRLEKPGLESLQNRSQNFGAGGLMATVPSEAGGSDPKVLKKIKNPKGMCAICGVTAALQLCSGCGQIAYCGREHQLQHWKEHKTDCKKEQAAKKNTGN